MVRGVFADTLPALHARVPSAAGRLLTVLRADSAARTPSLLAAAQAAAYRATQFRTGTEATSTVPRAPSQQDEPADFLRGWQRRASPASRALLLSQAGTHSARAFTVLPTSEDVVVPASHFRVFCSCGACAYPFLSARACPGRGAPDAYGDHRAACSTSDVFRRARLPSPTPRTRHRSCLPGGRGACRP